MRRKWAETKDGNWGSRRGEGGGGGEWKQGGRESRRREKMKPNKGREKERRIKGKGKRRQMRGMRKRKESKRRSGKRRQERRQGSAGRKVENGAAKSHERTIKALPANHKPVTAGRGDNSQTRRWTRLDTFGPSRNPDVRVPVTLPALPSRCPLVPHFPSRSSGAPCPVPSPR